ncbi:MAG: hypothetical protein JWP44_4510 [Mucilaginibacter sp.]|nr:hypothetical protein [Mucilaginibacter sp.]
MRADEDPRTCNRLGKLYLCSMHLKHFKDQDRGNIRARRVLHTLYVRS